MKHSGTRIFTAVIALSSQFELVPAKSATSLIAGLAAACIPAPTFAQGQTYFAFSTRLS